MPRYLTLLERGNEEKEENEKNLSGLFEEMGEGRFEKGIKGFVRKLNRFRRELKEIHQMFS